MTTDPVGSRSPCVDSVLEEVGAGIPISTHPCGFLARQLECPSPGVGWAQHSGDGEHDGHSSPNTGWGGASVRLAMQTTRQALAKSFPSLLGLAAAFLKWGLKDELGS